MTATIIVVLILGAAVFFAVRAIRRDKKSGKTGCGYASGCSGNCGSCPWYDLERKSGQKRSKGKKGR